MCKLSRVENVTPLVSITCIGSWTIDMKIINFRHFLSLSFYFEFFFFSHFWVDLILKTLQIVGLCSPLSIVNFCGLPSGLLSFLTILQPVEVIDYRCDDEKKNF